MNKLLVILNHTHTHTISKPIGPYTQSIDTGNIIFISGQIPIIPGINTIPNNICDQTYQTLKNIKNIIELRQLKINNIVKTTLFITNIHDLPEINNIYEQFFYSNNPTGEILNLPARSCVEVSNLPKNVKIEIEAIAIRFNK